jgi:1-hydroxycarotenoid 3,4-desaturase
VAASTTDHVVVLGGGIGGLSAAALLASRGLRVTLLERQGHLGGKLRQVEAGGRLVDAGPTVFTLPQIFEEIFAACGAVLRDEVRITEAEVLARHAFADGSRLDLFADPERTVDAVGAFAGRDAALAYRGFAAEAARIHATLAEAFMWRPRTNPIGLTFRLGLRRLPELQATRPYETMWKALRGHFRDPRLVQLFARYATYCGADPFRAPATLMLVAHVEMSGVWLVEGGLSRLAEALGRVAARQGATIRTGAEVAEILVDGGAAAGVRLASGEVIAADAVVANCDPSAIGSGRLGAAARRAAGVVPPRARSLSSLTLMGVGEADGFPLQHHNVFFSDDYAREFAEIRAGRLPQAPTVYLCAQDRGADGGFDGGPERVQIIVNAPATGDGPTPTEEEVTACETAMWTCLRRSGLSFRPVPGGVRRVTPADYETLFPSTGGALYGRASHGWAASFLRPGGRSRLPRLYLAGGACHPGPGVPMAAASGRLATEILLQDLASMQRSRRVATHGGMSTPSPTTASSGSPSSPSSAVSSRPIM